MFMTQYFNTEDGLECLFKCSWLNIGFESRAIFLFCGCNSGMVTGPTYGICNLLIRNDNQMLKLITKLMQGSLK